MTLGARIRALRMQQNLSQEELADAVSVTRQTIISLENGKYNASLLLAHEIARAFSRALLSAGNNIPAKIAIIAITTKSSINVKLNFFIFSFS